MKWIYLDIRDRVSDIVEDGLRLINIELITIITVLLSLFPVESNTVIIGKAFFLFGGWGGEFGEIIQTGNVETSVQLWLVWGKLRLHQLNRGGEETRQKGKVSNVEDRNFDYEKEGLITTQKVFKIITYAMKLRYDPRKCPYRHHRFGICARQRLWRRWHPYFNLSEQKMEF